MKKWQWMQCAGLAGMLAVATWSDAGIRSIRMVLLLSMACLAVLLFGLYLQWIEHERRRRGMTGTRRDKLRREQARTYCVNAAVAMLNEDQRARRRQESGRVTEERLARHYRERQARKCR